MSEPAPDTTPARPWDPPTGDDAIAGPVPSTPVPLASWPIRVTAVLLDQALVAGVAFLASGSVVYKGPTLHPGEPAQPRWRRGVGAVVIAAGVLGIAFSCAPTSGTTSGGINLQCWPSDTPDGAAGPVLEEVWATGQPSTEWTRLGVTRGDHSNPRLDVTWQITNDDGTDDATFAALQDTWWATVRDARGTVRWTVSASSAQAVDGMFGAAYTGDTVTATIPWETLGGPGVAGWTLEAGQIRDGQTVASCSSS